MPITSWIRDLFGIQKDMYETKKTRLEIEKIEDEKREKLITPATMEDVKKYDPSYAELMHQLGKRHIPGKLGKGASEPLAAAILFLSIHHRKIYRQHKKTFWLIVIIAAALVALSVWLSSR